MDLKKDFATDKNLENEGIWEDLGGGARIKVARSGNENYTKRFSELMKPHRRAIKRNTMSDKKAEKILIKVLAETILVDWEGIMEDGVEIAYSVENAIRILTEYKDFRDIVIDVSEAMENYKIREDADTEKN